MDDDGVLDPHAAASGQVDTWLDGDGNGGGQFIGGRSAQVWRLVDLQADSVTESVDELRTPTCARDDGRLTGLSSATLESLESDVSERLVGRLELAEAVAGADGAGVLLALTEAITTLPTFVGIETVKGRPK